MLSGDLEASMLTPHAAGLPRERQAAALRALTAAGGRLRSAVSSAPPPRAPPPKQCNSTHAFCPLVINLGVAKSGTMSLHNFFECNGWRASHNLDCGSRKRCSTRLSQFLDDARADARLGFLTPSAALERLRTHLGGYDAHTELNAAGGPGIYGECQFPQVERAAELVRAVPGACYVLTHRPAESWVRSMLTYHRLDRATGRPTNLSLGEEVVNSCARRQMAGPRSVAQLGPWYEEHVRRAKGAMRSAPCALALDIEAADAGEELAARFPGTNASCWPHAHPPGFSLKQNVSLKQMVGFLLKKSALTARPAQ